MIDDKEKTTRKKQPHHRLVTRRDFLAQGLAGMSATMFVPGMMGLLGSRSAFAEAVPSVPFMVFDLVGGLGLPGNFLVGKQDGPEDLLASYDLLGWNPRDSGALNKDFGLPLSAKSSKFLEGFMATASADARKNFRMGSFAHFSQDDTAANKTSAIQLVTKSGYRGAHLPMGLGRQTSLSGGNTDATAGEAIYKPLAVNAVSDLTGALSFGPGLKDIPGDIILELNEASRRLSQAQAERRGAEAEDLARAADRGFEANRAFARGATGVDPRSETIFQEVYGIRPDTAANDAGAIAATVAMNVLKGNTGPGVLTVPGCDYHGDTLPVSDAKDREVGVAVGRAVESAHRLGKRLFIQILTDGGVSAIQGKLKAPGELTNVWTSDSGDKSMTVIGYYDPKGPRTQRRLQVGHYTNGQGADRDTLIGGDVTKVAYAVLANYLTVTEKMGEFEKLAPRGLFEGKDLESILIF